MKTGKKQNAIINAADKGLSTVIEYGEAAFYGPKLDFMVKDALGRQWQLGTIKWIITTRTFDLTYKGSDNELHRPVMIHRALWFNGKIYSYFTRNTAGNFPLWLMPEQANILSLSEKYEIYAKKVLDLLENHEIAPLRQPKETIGKKLETLKMQKNPVYA
jgi:threonyl-tRNA synthetase